MTDKIIPPYLSKLEDMTRAAVAFQAKVWCDQLRAGAKFNNGDAFQGAMVDMITSGVRKGITPAHIDELEKRIVDLTFSTTPIDEHEAKYPNNYDADDGFVPTYRGAFHVDYHPCGVLGAALTQMDTDGGKRGHVLGMVIPVKSRTDITNVGVIGAFGYGVRDEGLWSTLRLTDAGEYTVVNRYLEKGRYGSGWINPPAGEEDLVWVQLSPTDVGPSVQILRFAGYCKTGYLDLEKPEGSLIYACSRVHQDGYLGLAVRS